MLLQHFQQAHAAQDVEDAGGGLVGKLRLVEADGDFGEIDIGDAADGAVEGLKLGVLTRCGGIDSSQNA